ncbi:hypothetical protein GGR52DRAFT_334574 [Hypoxylon sp. FL1284]|nr:hypothetical protein GGR52DRAFT_334574 [Hypoxylon sp. FL1284]
MSPVQSQFSLSLELTRFAPVLAIPVQAGLSLLARKLRNSGSDIVVEEDLARLFGRCYIAPNMSGTFRTIVGRGTNTSSLIADLELFCGPGPTVSRALTEPAGNPYFAMIVQCSLLTAIHDTHGLAGFLTRALKTEQDGAPADQARTVLSAESIRATLVAIQEQTMEFDWRITLLSIAHKLGLDGLSDAAGETIPGTILEGLVVMLASVQRFPEERMLLIETTQGVCVLVAWAHHVLGLSVLVRRVVDGQMRTDVFGDEREQVIIEQVESWREYPVTLLLSDGSHLFKLQADPDDYIDSTYRVPARGSGARLLRRDVGRLCGSESEIQKEGMLLSAAIASKFWGKLRVVLDDHNEPPPVNSLSHSIPKSYLYEATRFLFDVEEISVEDIDVYCRCLKRSHLDTPHRDLYRKMKFMPRKMRTVLERTKDAQKSWARLVDTCSELSMRIFAFAHVTNLSQCDELGIIEGTQLRFRTRFKSWESINTLSVNPRECMGIMIQLMTGSTSDIASIKRTSLVSVGGWSVFMSSMTESDPSLVRRGAVSIIKGVPCRGGVYKHGVVDDELARIPPDVRLRTREGPKAEISPKCLDPVRLGKTYIGEKGDSFLISLRYVAEHSEGTKLSNVRRTGFCELNSALWTSQNTAKCAHTSSKQDTMVLPSRCYTVSGFNDFLRFSGRKDVFIYQTSGSKHTRWRALLSIASIIEPHGTNYYRQYHPVLLKTDETCLRCAVKEAMSHPMGGPRFLVL